MQAVSDGIRLVDKPAGITSFAVIRTLRRALGKKKMGHAGTLDPLASGLLIVGVGSATKELAALTGLPKTYDVCIRIGERRDTGDTDGEIIATDIPDALSERTVRAVLERTVGDLQLPVPRYAAVKQGGEPLYKKARRGEDFEPPVRSMRVHSITFSELTHATDGFWYLSISMHVASGVYVRSVVEEIGARLGYPATVATLRRTHVGEYDVKHAERLDAF